MIEISEVQECVVVVDNDVVPIILDEATENCRYGNVWDRWDYLLKLIMLLF